MLAAILDGHFGRKELQLYREICATVDGIYQPHVSYIRYCAQRLRNTQPLEYTDLRHCVYLEPDDGAHQLSNAYWLTEAGHKIATSCFC